MKKLVGIGLAMLLLPWLVSLLWMRSDGKEASSLPEETKTAVMEEETALPEGEAEAAAAAVPRGEKKILVEREEISTYMDVEDYLPGVVVGQIQLDYEPEALKCQAVIARTYIYRIMDGRMEIVEEELDLDYLEEGQKNERMDKEKLAEGLARCKAAVEETKGVVMKYEDRYLLPLFHHASAGRTRTGEEDYPYLQSVESRWDVEDDRFVSKKEWEKSAFVQTMNHLSDAPPLQSEDPLAQIQTVKKDEAGYVAEIKIGARTYAGEEIQYALELPSSCYSFGEKNGKMVATVKGIGHGYGLSQAGAHGMAREGWVYPDILNYYYKNISIISE